TTMQHQSYSSGHMGQAFHATIMDLMRRGYGEFRPRARNKVDIQLHPGKDTTGLLPFEKSVLTYLKRAANPVNDLITHEALKRHSEKHASTFIQGWGRKVREWLEGQRGGKLTTDESRKVARRWALYSFLSA